MNPSNVWAQDISKIWDRPFFQIRRPPKPGDFKQLGMFNLLTIGVILIKFLSSQQKKHTLKVFSSKGDSCCQNSVILIVSNRCTAYYVFVKWYIQVWPLSECNQVSGILLNLLFLLLTVAETESCWKPPESWLLPSDTTLCPLHPRCSAPHSHYHSHRWHSSTCLHLCMSESSTCSQRPPAIL